MSNTLTIIGFIGIKKAYLNITKEEAIRRFCENNEITEEFFKEYHSSNLEVINFDDEFEVYDAWQTEN